MNNTAQSGHAVAMSNGFVNNGIMNDTMSDNDKDKITTAKVKFI